VFVDDVSVVSDCIQAISSALQLHSVSLRHAVVAEYQQSAGCRG